MATFLRDPNEVVQAYVTGACRTERHSTDPNAGYGVWFNNSHPLNLSDGLTSPDKDRIITKQEAEIIAASRAIQQALKHRVTSLHIYSDSEYVVKGITERIHGWRRRGWKNPQGQPIPNSELFQALGEIEKKMKKVFWKYIPAQRKHYGIEAANKLAQEAMMSWRSS